jgi:hypothetical protein
MMRETEVGERLPGVGRNDRFDARRQSAGCALLAVAVWMMMVGGVSVASADVFPQASSSLEPMTDAEAVGMGCMLMAAGVGAATITAGGVALIAAEAGVAATGTAVAVPVVVATMAGGCTIGAVAAPAFLWLKRQGHTIGTGVAGILPSSVR